MDEQCQELERKLDKVTAKKGADIDELRSIRQGFSEHFVELERKVHRTESGFEQLQRDHTAIQAELTFRATEWAQDSKRLHERADVFQASISDNRIEVASILDTFAHTTPYESASEPF